MRHFQTFFQLMGGAALPFAWVLVDCPDDADGDVMPVD